MALPSRSKCVQQAGSFPVGVNIRKPFHQATIDDNGTATRNDTNLVQNLTDKQKKKACGSESKLITGSSGRGSSCSSMIPNERQIPVEEDENQITLPDLAIRQVLKNIPDSAQCNTILNCRLACVQWNQIIEDTSALMKKITFPVKHPKTFLDLPIVKKGKVKSIKIIKAWPLDSIINQKLTNNFIDTINKIVEKIHFEFEVVPCKEEIELFLLILNQCENLQELIVTEMSFFGNPFADSLLRSISTEIKIRAAEKIQLVLFKKVGHNGFQLQDSNALTKFLLKFPRLKEIKLVGRCKLEVLNKVCEGLLEYLEEFGPAIHLKKLTLPSYESFNPAPILNSLLLQCGKYSIVFDGLPTLDLNSLLACRETSNLDIFNQEQPLFYGKVNGLYSFEKKIMVNSNLARLGRLDVRQLMVRFEREIMQGELGWIGNLKRLEVLHLIKCMSLESSLGAIATAEFEEVMSAGLDSLKVLEITDDIFGSILVFRWGQYFPNLTKLTIRSLNSTTNDLIADLAALEYLTVLNLCHLPNLGDAAFTAAYAHTGGLLPSLDPAAVPAIACFKSLKHLEISLCPKLTNACIINGISKCGTLKKLVIKHCKNITKNAMEVLVNLEVDFMDHNIRNIHN